MQVCIEWNLSHFPKSLYGPDQYTGAQFQGDGNVLMT